MEKQESNYNWKMKGLAKKVDPSKAAEELQRLQNVYGIITPEIIVNESENPKAVLHPIFEWDDSKAAFNYRLQQARILLNNIQMTVITDGEPKEISVYEVTSFKDGYKSIDTFTPDDIEYVRNSIAKDLNSMRSKLKLYKEFDKVLFYIEKAIEVIN
jgi:hypothetical protein